MDGFSGGVFDSGCEAGVSGDSGAGSVLIGTVMGVADTFVHSSLVAGGPSGDVFMVTPILPDSLLNTSTFRLVVGVVVDGALDVVVATASGAAVVRKGLLRFLLPALDWLNGWSSLLLEFVSSFRIDDVVEPIRAFLCNIVDVFFKWFEPLSDLIRTSMELLPFEVYCGC